MSDFSKRLIFLRKEKRWTQEELSKKSGVSQQAISKIESDLRSPTETTMEMLSSAFGLTLAEMLAITLQQKPQTTVYDTPLLPTERELISDFRQLNRQGQAYILQQMEIAKKIYGQSEDLPDLEDEQMTGGN